MSTSPADVEITWATVLAVSGIHWPSGPIPERSTVFPTVRFPGSATLPDPSAYTTQLVVVPPVQVGKLPAEVMGAQHCRDADQEYIWVSAGASVQMLRPRSLEAFENCARPAVGSSAASSAASIKSRFIWNFLSPTDYRGSHGKALSWRENAPKLEKVLPPSPLCPGFPRPRRPPPPISSRPA